jgi:hypothetical protein
MGKRKEYAPTDSRDYDIPRDYEEGRIPSVLKVGGKGLERRAKFSGKQSERYGPTSGKKNLRDSMSGRSTPDEGPFPH